MNEWFGVSDGVATEVRPGPGEARGLLVLILAAGIVKLWRRLAFGSDSTLAGGAR